MAIKVSVVIPTYKRTALLGRCLEALFNQHFDSTEYEIIIITDGPDYVTEAYIKIVIAQHTNNNIRLLSLDKKAGPAAARNKGWREAKGELVLFTDDDCIADANWIPSYWNEYEKIEADSTAAFTGNIQVPLTDAPTDFEKNTANLEEAEFVTANCACTKKALHKTNGFDEAFTMAWREDSDLHFKLLAANIPITKVRQAIIVHPARKAPWGVSIKEQKKGMFNALLYKKHPYLYQEKIGIQPLFNYYLMILLAVSAAVCFMLGAATPALICFMLWLISLTRFAVKRLLHTSLAISHVAEMLVTSVVIPFLSVYWTLYGSLKFKKLLL